MCGHRAKCRSGGIGLGSAGKRPGRVDIRSDGVGTEPDSVDIWSGSVGHRISMSVVQGQAIWAQGQV